MTVKLRNNSANHHLVIGSYNVHSLKEREGDFLYSMELFDICGISETWDIFEGESEGKDLESVNFGGYEGIGFRYRSGKRGLCVFYKKNIDVKFLKEYSYHDEDIAIVTCLKNDICICFAYIPNGRVPNGMQCLVELGNALSEKFTKLVIMGDWNARWVFTGPNYIVKNASGRLLEEWIHSSVSLLRVPIDIPTFQYGSSCLDHCLYQGVELHDYGYIPHLSSDHCPIWVNIKLNIPKWIERKKLNLQKAISLIEEGCLSFNDFNDLNEQVNQFNTFIKECLHQATKYVRQRINSKHVWFDIDLRKLVKTRNSHKRGSAEWIRLTRTLRKELRKREAEAYTRWITKGLEDKNAAWKLFNSSKARDINQKLNVNNKEAASSFKKFHIIDGNLLHHVKAGTHLSNITLKEPFRAITEEELKLALKDLAKKRSTGPDGISQLVVASLGPNAQTFLLRAYNYSLRRGDIPIMWKIAKVKPLAKPTGGFRPISLLCGMSKLLERIIYKRLLKQVEQKIPEYQYCFQGGTEMALEKLVSSIEAASIRNEVTYAVFLDVVKAFDRVYIPKLLASLDNIDTYILQWLRSYLLGRKAYVGAPEFAFNIANGVPQGSILSPLLFMVYVADIFRNIECDFVGKYADDFEQSVFEIEQST